MSNTCVQLTSASVTLTGSSQTLLAANPGGRSFLLIANAGAAAAWVNLMGGTAAANGTDCLELAAAGSSNSWIQFSGNAIPGNAITVIGTSSDKVTCLWA